LGFTSTRPTRSAPGSRFATTKLGQGALEARPLLVELRETLYNQISGLVEYVRRTGH
jgi:hypothetical protein